MNQTSNLLSTIRQLLEKEGGSIYFKNYKEMCNTLSLPIKAGKSKTLQIARLGKIVNLYKEEHSQGFYISELYEETLENKVDELTYAIYCKLKQIDANFIIMPNMKLWTKLGFLKSDPDLLDSILPEQNAFFNSRTHQRFSQIFESCLNKLQKENVLTWEKGLVLDGNISPNDYELQIIDDIENELYEEYKIDKQKFNPFHKYWKTFYQERIKRFIEVFPNHHNCYNGYYIYFTNNDVPVSDFNIRAAMVDIVKDSLITSYKNYKETINEEIEKFILGKEEDKKKHSNKFIKMNNIFETDYEKNLELYIENNI